LAGNGEVVLPADGNFECVGGDYLERCHHDGRRKYVVGYWIGGRIIECESKLRKDVLHPDSDTINGFRMIEQTGAVGGTEGEEQVHYIFISDSHCEVC
jgi:hypothetical protein